MIGTSPREGSPDAERDLPALVLCAGKVIEVFASLGPKV
jgi:hypothetical protein